MPIVLTASDAAAIARRARNLLRRSRLTHRQAVLLDTLLWSCRAHGQAVASASYSVLQRLANVTRATIAEGLRVLEGLGLIRRIKRRALVLWHNGGRAWRQLPSEYQFPTAPDCEFSGRTDSESQVLTIVAQPDGNAARTALADVRERRHAQLLKRGCG